MTAMLEFSAVDAYYGQSHVLHGVSLTIEPGEAVLLIGRNGAGKTTTMRAIMGLATVGHGEIRFQGRPVTGLATHRIARRGVGLVPDTRRMFAALTVAENLELGLKALASDPSAPAKSRQIWDVPRALNLFPALQPLLGRRAGALSGGQQQMLAIARTLVGNPSLLLLDEPMEGLAPVIVEELAARLVALRKEGLAMLLSEQNLALTRALADRAYVLETGYVRHQGTLAELEADPQAWSRYVAF